jgi:hypothetical protein
MNYFYVIFIVLIAFILKSNYYNTNIALNIYHITDKIIHLFLPTFHMIDESDLKSINKFRKLYSMSSMMEKRYNIESINEINITSAGGDIINYLYLHI